MKNKFGVLTMIVVCIIIVLIPLLGYWLSYKKRIEAQKKEYYPIISEAMFFWGGNYKVLEDRVELSQENFYDPVKAKMVISHYNYYNNDDITYEELKTEFSNFCDGTGSYKNLLKYADHYKKYDQMSFGDMTVDKIRMDCYIEQACAYFDACYADDASYNENRSTLTDEEIDSICRTMLSKKENLYLAVIYSDTNGRCDLTYPLFYHYFDESQIQTDGSGQKYVKVSDAEIYYLSYGNIDLVSDEEVWYVSGVEISGSSDKTIISACIGESKDKIKTRLERQMMEGVNVISETENSIACAQGPYYATIDFVNGISTKITLEIKE